MKNSFTDQLIRIMGGIPYHGCSIVSKDNKFFVLGISFETLTEAKNAIDKSFFTLAKTIRL